MSRRAPGLLLALCLGVFSLAATSKPAQAYLAVTSNIAASTSWGPLASGATVTADVFWIQNSITVNPSVTLTLFPGTIIKFSSGATLTVQGSVHANGTGGNLIHITSIKDDSQGGDTAGDGATVGSASDWGGINVTTVASPDSTNLTFCDIAYAGYGARAAVQFQSTSGVIKNCTIRRSYFGVDAAGTAAPLLVDTSIQTSTSTPVVMDFAALPTFNRLQFSQGDNGEDALGLHGGSLGSGTATIPKRSVTVGVTLDNNVTYVLLTSATINALATLNINSGVVIKVLGGYIDNFGALNMNGVAGDSVTVTSINDDNYGQPADTRHDGSTPAANRGDWGSVYFENGATGTLSYTRLTFGQSSLSIGLVDVATSSPSINHCLLSDAGHGVVAHGSTSAPALNTVSINNCISSPILMSVNSGATFASLSFLNNGITALGLIGETLPANGHLTQRTLAIYSNITYYIMGVLTIPAGVTLTVDPGVVVKFQYSGSGIEVGGALSALGTSVSPIVFTSEKDDNYGNPPDTNNNGLNNPASGDWQYIHFATTSNNALCHLTYCRITYSGSNGQYYAQVWISNCAPTISNCFFTKSNQYGIGIDGAATPTLSADTLSNCSYAPIIMSVQADPTLTNLIFLNNAQNGLALISETITQNSTLKYRPGVTFSPPATPTVFAYIPTGNIIIPSGVTLVVQPQVILKPSSSFTLFTVNGTLNMVGGTGANRIVITSYKDDVNGGDTNGDNAGSSAASGDWGNILFNDTSVDAACILRNCLFQFGGSGGNSAGTITTQNASPTLCALDFFSNNTVMTFGGSSTPKVDSLSVLNCTQIPIVLSLMSDPQFAASPTMTFANNAYTALGILGETVATDTRTTVRTLGTGILKNITYMLAGNLIIGASAKWTIMPGICIKMGRIGSDPAGYLITIDGALVANGKSPDSLIVFTSSADDQFGGDTHGDGAATHPGFGDWGSITFSALNNSAATVVNNCLFRYAGYSEEAIYCVNSSPTITNCTLTSNYAGISVSGAGAPVFTNCNIDSSYYLPIRMSLVSNPTFNNVQFKSNGWTGLGVINETIAQDLLWKIRPVSGRLNMPYILDGTVGVGLGSTMTLQPGLIVKMRGGAGIDVQRALYAQGKAVPESLIVFTSSRDDAYGGRTDTTAATTPAGPGDWASVRIEGTAIDANVKIHDCVFRYGGGGSTLGALRAISSSPAVDSCLIMLNTCGVSVEGNGNPTINGSSLYGNTYYAINNTGNSFCTDATHNWWGAANGPNDASATPDICYPSGQINAGAGDIVSNNVNYASFATTGILNSLLGDVSLNGTVRAYDASLILQSLALLISLGPQQQTNADVDGNGTINALDASDILQFVAGSLLALPGNRTHAHPVSPDHSLAALPGSSSGQTFSISLGTAVRAGDRWQIPVMVTGDGDILGVEVRLEGASAATFVNAVPQGGALAAFGTDGKAARLAMASATPLAEGQVATLEFAAGTSWTPPTLSWARVNNFEQKSAPVAPSLSFLAPPGPNPARDAARISYGIGASEDGANARIDVLDLAGRRVRTLLDGPVTAGPHALVWDLRDADGTRVAPGMYMVRATAGRFEAHHRLIVVR
jgi:parallel beta-helix repeat protein